MQMPPLDRDRPWLIPLLADHPDFEGWQWELLLQDRLGFIVCEAAHIRHGGRWYLVDPPTEIIAPVIGMRVI